MSRDRHLRQERLRRSGRRRPASDETDMLYDRRMRKNNRAMERELSIRDHIEDEYGWSRKAFTLGVLTYALLGPLLGLPCCSCRRLSPRHFTILLVFSIIGDTSILTSWRYRRSFLLFLIPTSSACCQRRLPALLSSGR